MPRKPSEMLQHVGEAQWSELEAQFFGDDLALVANELANQVGVVVAGLDQDYQDFRSVRCPRSWPAVCANSGGLHGVGAGQPESAIGSRAVSRCFSVRRYIRGALSSALGPDAFDSEQQQYPSKGLKRLSVGQYKLTKLIQPR